MTSIQNKLFVLIIISWLFSNQDVFEWNSITSVINPTALSNDANGDIIASTHGGLLLLADNELEVIKDNLNNLDLSVLGLDNNNLIWAGGSFPSGNIQVFDSNYNLVYDSIYQLPELEDTPNYIIDFAFHDSRVFAIYSYENEIGILEFRYENDIPYYLDYYNQDDFPELINNIYDIDLYQETIYVTTDLGIFSANFTQDELSSVSSWELESFGILEDPDLSPNILFMSRNSVGFYLIIPEGLVFTQNCLDCIDGEAIENWFIEYQGDPIDIMDESDFPIFCTTQECCVIENSSCSLIFQTENQFSINSYFKSDNQLFLGIQNGGIAKIELDIGYNISHFIPNTLLQSQYEAITLLDNGSLAGVSKSNGFIYDGNQFSYFIPSAYIDLFPIELLSEKGDFNIKELDYRVGDKMIWSIIENNSGNIMFNNSGIKPDQSGKRGAIIEINPENFDFVLYDTSKTEYMESFSYPFGTLDGLFGISNQDVTSNYMVTHQLKKDQNGNIWVVNPFSETYNHPLSVQIYNNTQHWMHIFSDDQISYVPTELAFDRYNRGWLGFKKEGTNNNVDVNEFSNGGIKLFSYNDYIYSTNFDSYSSSVQWFYPENLEELPYGENTTVWSLDIGSVNNQDILWILTPQGAQGYILNNTQLIKIYPLDFYANLTFQQGDKIRVDSQNNAWISTRHSGVRVIKNNATLWPDGEGFSSSNSPLLSDYVYDIDFDNKNGKVYLATVKGISILNVPFSTENELMESLYITPQPFVIPSDYLMEIKKIISGSDVKILDLNGQVLKHFNNLEYNQNILYWDGKGDSGDYLSTGIYYILSYKNEQAISKKIAIVRK